jgi:tRNA(fMet)-specific endonuclease VapC
MFILDTDHLGILQRQTLPHYTNLTRRISQHAESNFFVTIVSFHEQVVGWNAYLS